MKLKIYFFYLILLNILLIIFFNCSKKKIGNNIKWNELKIVKNNKLQRYINDFSPLSMDEKYDIKKSVLIADNNEFNDYLILNIVFEAKPKGIESYFIILSKKDVHEIYKIDCGYQSINNIKYFWLDEKLCFSIFYESGGTGKSYKYFEIIRLIDVSMKTILETCIKFSNDFSTIYLNTLLENIYFQTPDNKTLILEMILKKFDYDIKNKYVLFKSKEFFSKYNNKKIIYKWNGSKFTSEDNIFEKIEDELNKLILCLDKEDRRAILGL